MGDRKAREIRLKKNLDLSDVAHLTGISTTYLSWYETGKRDPDINRASKLSELYGVPLKVLFPDTARKAQELAQRWNA